jgi:hypothetical protein
MIRITAYGLLVGWGNVALWVLLPMAGTMLGLFIWYLLRAFVEWRMPEIAKVKAAREECRQVILALKAKLCDTLVEMNRAQKTEKQMADVLEEMRSAHRNLNARATSALHATEK